MKTLLSLLVLLALCLSSVAAPSPPLLYTRYTTNTTPVVDSFVVRSSNGFGTNNSFIGSTNFGSTGMTNWTTTTSNGWINTNISGGSVTIKQGNVSASGTVSVGTLNAGTTTVTNNFTVTQGSAQFRQTVFANNSVNANQLTVTNASTFKNNLRINGNATVDGTLTTTNPVIGGVLSAPRLYVSQDATVDIFTNLGISYLSGSVGIGAAPAGPALLDIANGALTNEYFWRGTNTGTGQGGGFKTNGNLAISGSAKIGGGLTVGGTLASFNQVQLGNADGGILYWSGGSGMFPPTNGTLRFHESAGYTLIDTLHGCTLLFNQVTKLPFPAASKGVLTNLQWGIGNTNGCLTSMTSTNGTNRLDMMGLTSSNLWLSSQMYAQQPVVCYGSMMMRLTNTLAVGPSAYTNIQNYDVAVSNQFFCNVTLGVMTNYLPGYYRVTICKSAIAGASSYTQGCFLTNGVDSELISFHKEFAAGTSRIDNNSATGVIWLPANTQCSFAVKDSAAENITIRRAQFTIGTP